MRNVLPHIYTEGVTMGEMIFPEPFLNRPIFGLVVALGGRPLADFAAEDFLDDFEADRVILARPSLKDFFLELVLEAAPSSKSVISEIVFLISLSESSDF